MKPWARTGPELRFAVFLEVIRGQFDENERDDSEVEKDVVIKTSNAISVLLPIYRNAASSSNNDLFSRFRISDLDPDPN